MKETWRKVSKILWKIAKISLAIMFIAYIALMTYAINELQNDVYNLSKRVYELENQPNLNSINDFYITYADEFRNTVKQIHFVVDKDPSQTW